MCTVEKIFSLKTSKIKYGLLFVKIQLEEFNKYHSSFKQKEIKISAFFHAFLVFRKAMEGGSVDLIITMSFYR